MTRAPEPADNVVRLIVGGLEGKLSTAGGQPVPVRVFERPGQELMVVLMVAADGALEHEPLVVEYASARGLVRLRGRAVLEGRDLLRFRVAHELEVIQRREFVRVGVVQRVILLTDAGELSAHAIEVSGGGMLLTAAEPLHLGAPARFSLHLGADGLPIKGRGRVVRIEDEGRRAIEFDEISRTDRQRLIHFILERQRAPLAKGGEVAPLKRKLHPSEGLT
jgi:hypothetical protein